VRDLIKDGYHPIVFCRFIPTADYVAEELRKALKGVEVISITGVLPPAEREARINQLGEGDKVLVCTDCLSEGINLQDYFDAVVHYDLSWNPTRHEQREGRVDRFGQPNKKVRTVTYYGIDNKIDGIVLDVLIRKHRSIRKSLGISVPIPVNTDDIIEAVFEGLLLREKSDEAILQYLPGFEEYIKPKKEQWFKEWDVVVDREKRSQTMFAQRTIKVEEVARELKAAQEATGSGVDLEVFVRDAFRANKAVVSGDGDLKFELQEVPQPLKDLIGFQDGFEARFEKPVQKGQLYLIRTHPVVEGLASYVMDTALDPLTDGVAKRCGAIKSKSITRRTTLLLLRCRFLITAQVREYDRQILAEDTLTLAYEGAPDQAVWLGKELTENLLTLTPDDNIPPESARQFIERVFDGFDELEDHLEEVVIERSMDLLDAHRRVRSAASLKNIRYKVGFQLPPDVLGIYVYLPA